MNRNLRIAGKLIAPLAIFTILPFINKGWSGLFLLAAGFFIFPAVLIMLALFFFAGKREAKQVWQSYFFISANMILIAFTTPGITDIAETSSAFTLLNVTEGSIIYRLSAYTTAILCIALVVNLITQIITLAKSPRRNIPSLEQPTVDTDPNSKPVVE